MVLLLNSNNFTNEESQMQLDYDKEKEEPVPVPNFSVHSILQAGKTNRELAAGHLVEHNTHIFKKDFSKKPIDLSYLTKNVGGAKSQMS